MENVMRKLDKLVRERNKLSERIEKLVAEVKRLEKAKIIIKK